VRGSIQPREHPFDLGRSGRHAVFELPIDVPQLAHAAFGDHLGLPAGSPFPIETGLELRDERVVTPAR
jgi:hypothetical protein